jgi:hypothetical protein
MKTTAKKVMREIKLNSVKDLIWRNLPAYPSTFGPCLRNCGSGQGGRGGGPCVECAELDLAEIVGDDLAGRYRDAIEDVRQLEKEMEGKV